ncbi:hypothetical protein GCM10010218_42180 [Streptomyces mashuensis]|uniref:Uncharacterized protein n=1 Tax=Streptomyces mashuensis TaxID=33904 RepID=A0A919B6D6_9ACTN|nr:hypothetical protein [Streptomyces mashuensis]GHF56409.1 hypothetical protein GCM10010218_42180 [Streptomyces mashuensis]
MYSIEMAYARMRELQDLANRSRAHQTPAALQRAAAVKIRLPRAKKR